MGRRTILLILAAMIAVLGAGMVFLYVKGADTRARQGQEPIAVLKAVAQIEPGESLSQASAAGKIELKDVPLEQKLDGAMASIGSSGSEVALTRIYPNEQITASKFGSPGEQDALTMPNGDFAISVQLSDTGRVAGFVVPGSKVAIWEYLFFVDIEGHRADANVAAALAEVEKIAGYLKVLGSYPSAVL